MQAAFAKTVEERALNASLIPLARRVPHRQRVELALADGGAGEAFFFGLAAAVVTGSPVDRSIRIVSEPMPEDGDDRGRWRRVRIECRPELAVATTVPVTHVFVESAGILVADVDALPRWNDEPADGMADFVFWGRDAEEVARRTGAPLLENGQYGWKDLPIDEAVERGERVEELRGGTLRFATDFRPHTHHYFAMEQVREGHTESGVVTVGGAKMCVFMTTWGDGAFLVTRDLASDGALVRVTIDLGTEEIVARQRSLEAR